MQDCLIDGLLDTLKLLPYLLATFLLLEFIEHKLKSKKILSQNQKVGPLVGGLLGALPQCGFSAMAANLFSNKIITTGTLIAVFLSTSDEMLPIMLSENADIVSALEIIGIKVIIGIVIGFIVDLIYKRKLTTSSKEISKMCDHEHCECEKDGIFLSSLKHTLKIGLFVLIANLLINMIIFLIGEENLSDLLLAKNILTYFLASLIGLIPNCASSIIITELYLSGLITTGTMFAGLLTGSGLGILLLFKSNKNLKENFSILAVIYFVGVVAGLIVDLFA